MPLYGSFAHAERPAEHEIPDFVLLESQITDRRDVADVQWECPQYHLR
jgi:hypothetical protein